MHDFSRLIVHVCFPRRTCACVHAHTLPPLKPSPMGAGNSKCPQVLLTGQHPRAGAGAGGRDGGNVGGGRWGGGLIDAEGNCWEQLPSTITRPGNCWRNNYPNNYPQQLPPNANGVYARSEFQVRVIG